MRDVLLVVDVVDDFLHPDGATLLASFRERAPQMRAVLELARARRIPVVFANDNRGIWDGDRSRLVRDAAGQGLGADIVELLQPLAAERFLIKPRYSAFDLTPLPLILDELDADRLVLIGATAEMCVTQTAIDARERDYKVTVLGDACACIDESIEEVAFAYLRTVTGTFVTNAYEWSP